MIEGSKKGNRQLAFELQNLHVCEKRSNNNFPHVSGYFEHFFAVIKPIQHETS